jgi:hypothetical protein
VYESGGAQKSGIGGIWGLQNRPGRRITVLFVFADAILDWRLQSGDWELGIGSEIRFEYRLARGLAKKWHVFSYVAEEMREGSGLRELLQ